MPPKISTTKEMIIEAGYSIADEEGIGQVNCRAIAKKLGCSTQPVFNFLSSSSILFTFALLEGAFRSNVS